MTWIGLIQASSFKSKIGPIPHQVQLQMKQLTYRNGCPVAISNLRYVELSYWGFDEKVHQGALIVNQELADEVVAIFKTLFLHKFLIHKIIPIEIFQGNDNASMEANNTSAFNCREVTGRPGEFSQHSYGRAIDINPLINPYVNGQSVSPKGGILYVNRKKPTPGKIMKGDIVYQTFIEYGWDWAGDWYDVQDYQHFEKRANGEKRNPYGG